MLVDTNILVYAINKDSSKSKLARSFLQKTKVGLEVSHQNIFEAYRVLTHRKFSNPMKIKAAQEEILEAIKNCRIIVPDKMTHHLAFALIEKNDLTGNKVFDAYLAAVAISNEVTQIATDNEKDFKKFGISVYNPFKS
ncbi:MAG: type II toxin-antitoxin system VapC family toxin [Ginsengibacter sp.]